ncbi:MAG: arylsulfatase A-like enzyme [Verrucomicrobiales bacterium]
MALQQRLVMDHFRFQNGLLCTPVDEPFGHSAFPQWSLTFQRHSGKDRRMNGSLTVLARLFLLICLAAGVIQQATGAEQQRPNIVVFLVDDLGWQDTSVVFTDEPTPSNLHFRTPNLQRLAQQGVRFTSAYACAVCTPSRVSLMTGLNAARHGTTNWTLFTDRETSGVTPRLSAPAEWKRRGLQPDARQHTLAEILRDDLGYRTIHAGKAHWGAWDTPGADPTNLGFDDNIAGHAAGGPGHYHGDQAYGNLQGRSKRLPWGVPGLHKYHGTATHLTEATTTEALAAVRRAVDDKKPFFLHLAHYAVHAPIQPHQSYMDHYAGKTYKNTEILIPPAEQKYASMVEGMDASLGRVLRELEALQIAENTLILFASDNGGLSYHGRGTSPRNTGRNSHCWPLREGKGSAYEGGIRIPLVVSWAKLSPAHPLQQQIPIANGGHTSHPVIIEDFFPAVLHWAGAEEVTLGRDGIDFTSLLNPQYNDDHRNTRALYFHYPHQWTGKPQGGYQPHSSIIFGDWKAIYFYEGQRWELYNLARDIGEQHDQAADAPDQLDALAAMLKAYLVRVGAQWPTTRQSERPEPMKVPH